MKKILVVWVVLSFFIFLSFAAAQYSNYVKGRPLPSTTVTYSLPDFGGKTHYWVKDFAPRRSLGEGGGYVVAGSFFYSPIISGDKIIKNRSWSKEYFFQDEMAKDPRLSLSWRIEVAQLASIHSFHSLWNAVENAALTGFYPQVTMCIISHMINCGVVTSQEVDEKKMSHQRIQQAMLDYTDIALNFNTQCVLKKIGGDTFIPKEGKKGDIIEFYFWPNYGPAPIPERIAIFNGYQKNKDGEYISIFFEGRETGIHWHKVDANEKKFVALRRRRE